MTLIFHPVRALALLWVLTVCRFLYQNINTTP